MIHKRCFLCRKIGHKPDMIKDIWHGAYVKGLGEPTYTSWYHRECYIKEFKVKEIHSMSERKMVWVKKGK